MYKIVYLPTAKRDIEEAFKYIAVELSAPDAAQTLLTALDEAVRALSAMPYRHSIYHCSKYGINREIRFFPMNSYNVFYVVREEQKTVEIQRVLHFRRSTPEM